MIHCAIKKCLKKPFNPLDIIKEIEWALSEDKDGIREINKEGI